MGKRRFPRKAKKWAKKTGVMLSFVEGKRIWYYIESERFMVKNIYR
jgi:hypothetical protein